MPRKMTTQAGGLEIEDGTYRVKLISLDDIEMTWEGRTRPGLKWTFILPDVQGEDGEAGELTAQSSTALSPKSKLWAWYQSLTGETLELDMQIDLDDMIDKEAQAAVIHKPGGDGTGSWPRIENLMALPKTGKAKASQAPPDPFEGFRKGSAIDWANFAACMQVEEITPLDIAAYMGVEKCTREAMGQWVTSGKGTLRDLLLNAAKQKHEGVDPDDLPFE